MRIVTLLLCTLLASPVIAASVYRWVDAEGTVHFTDQPRPGAERVEVEPIQTYTPREVTALEQAGGAPAGQGGEATSGYSRFEFLRPEPEQGIRANDGRVDVQMALEPALRDGHRLQVSLDGETLRGDAPPSFSIPGMERGTHTLAATIRDAGGDVLARAGPVTFHVLRVHLGTPPGPTGGNPAP